MVCIYIFPFNVLLYPFPLKFNNFQFCWKLDIWILLYGNSEFRFLRIYWVLILQAFSVPGFRLRCLAPKGKQWENEAGQNSGSVALNTLLQPIGVVTMGPISLIRSNNQHTQLFALGLTGEWQLQHQELKLTIPSLPWKLHSKRLQSFKIVTSDRVCQYNCYLGGEIDSWYFLLHHYPWHHSQCIEVLKLNKGDPILCYRPIVLFRVNYLVDDKSWVEQAVSKSSHIQD